MIKTAHQGVQPFTAKSLVRQLLGNAQNVQQTQSHAMENVSEERRFAELLAGDDAVVGLMLALMPAASTGILPECLCLVICGLC
jgi:hypothetical protein